MRTRHPTDFVADGSKMLAFGANPRDSRTEFRVWAPAAKKVSVRLLQAGKEPQDIAMKRENSAELQGTFSLLAEAGPRDRYFYVINDHPLQMPDPVSRYLPAGVHGPTEIVDLNAFKWTDADWRGIPCRDLVIYELHVGTFTPEGTFDGVIEKFEYLRELGVTAVEIMPVAAFPGRRNWGYDGASLYAVQESYGGPEGLKRLVNAAHAKGIAVILDVVYNHLGNEGNYLGKFGPYFTHKHQTPWGDAINYDDKDCKGVRQFVVNNALYWIDEYHLDGLRLDAVQTIKDDSPTHILAELRDSVQRFAKQAGREVNLIAETDENSPRYVLPREIGGYGLNGVWSDDFHHAAHALFTGEREGYYQDFGREEQLVKALNEGFVYQGEIARFWNGPRGEVPNGMPVEAHVLCIQNHDQVGNRALGERLTDLVPRGIRKLLSALLLLAPETPLLFMGQEYDETHPFQFFTDYGDPKLQKAVCEGRRAEFKDFTGFGNDFPDPQDPATFEHSKLNWERTPEQQEMLDWYRQLIALRQQLYGGTAERNCRASLPKTGVIRLQVPADNPKLVLDASWSGELAESTGFANLAEEFLFSEDGCRLRLLLAPELQGAKQRCA